VGTNKCDATKSVSRKHVIELDEKSGLVSLMGGKWTSYRKMGVDTVKFILQKNSKLSPKHSETQTLNFNFIGSYSAMELINQMKQTNSELEKQYVDNMVFIYDIDREVAKELYKLYGTVCLRVVHLGVETKTNERLHEDLPYLKSQVLYAV